MNKIETVVIVADENELRNIKINNLEEITINQFKYWKVKIGDQIIAMVWSGIGIPNSAACAQSIINNFKSLKRIINFGSCGALSPAKLYDVITPEKIFFHDVATPWYKLGQTPGEKEFYTNSYQTKNNLSIGSGNSFITNLNDIKKLSQELNIHLFDMEVAAIAQIAFKNNVKLVVIKSVSDIIGSNDEAVEDINDRIAKAGMMAWNLAKEYIDNI